MKNEKILLCIIIIQFIFLFTSIPIILTSDAKVGYDINVVVNNSTATSQWSRSQSTEVLYFYEDGSCSGVGNSSKYAKISGFAGIDTKETTHTKKGQLITADSLTLASAENQITIEESVRNNSYEADINESLPTIMIQKSNLFYKGLGINTKNIYINNDDKIITNYNGKSLTKLAGYGAVYNNALIHVDIIPGRVNEIVDQNYTSAFSLSSASDTYSGLGFASSKEFIEEVYPGNFKVNLRILKDHRFYRINDTNSMIGFDCCIPRDGNIDGDLPS